MGDGSSNACFNCGQYPCICIRPETETFNGGAKRDRENIPDYRLIPHCSLKRLAQRYSHGAVKYGDRNWEDGDIKFRNDCLNRAAEHLYKYTSGDRCDDHLAAVAWNVFAVMFFEERELEAVAEYQANFVPEVPTENQTELGLFCPPQCRYLSPTEAEQDSPGALNVHQCCKYLRRVFHMGAAPNIYRCEACLRGGDE